MAVAAQGVGCGLGAEAHLRCRTCGAGARARGCGERVAARYAPEEVAAINPLRAQDAGGPMMTVGHGSAARRWCRWAMMITG